MAEYRVAFFGVKSWERLIVEKEIANLDSVGVGIFESEVQETPELARKYEILSVSIHGVMDKTTLDKLPELKMIATRSTGTDHIDLLECGKRKIAVTSVPEYGARSVAEYTAALMLAVAKKIIPAHQSIENGEFSPEGLTGIDLFGKTLGVVGVGKIGANVVKIGRGLGMKVLGVERTPDPKLAKKLGFRYADLETCLREADVVTLHVPSNPETFHLINRKNIKLMKETAILINTCRGPVVETEALLSALNSHKLRGAGLDVTEEEDQVENISMVTSKRPTKDDLQEVLSYHLLRDRDDVVFTPHNAFNTEEAIGRIVKTTIENIEGFIKK
jgi:D-lactate dehydrogenase